MVQLGLVEPPEQGEYSPPFAGYIEAVRTADPPSFLGAQLAQFQSVLADLSESAAVTLHPPYTWSIKQVVGHVSDCERVFAYRALRIARGDVTPLPSFDENQFMAAADFNRLPISFLWKDFAAVRQATIKLIEQFDQQAWRRTGVVCGGAMSCRAMVYALMGHANHHLRIVTQRLGQQA